MNLRLTRSLVTACDCMVEVADDFENSVNALSLQSAGCGDLPSVVVARALDCYGGIICEPLYYMRYQNPTLVDMPFMQGIASAISRIYETTRKIMGKLGIAVKYLKRFEFRPHQIFSTDYFALTAARYRISASECRERIIESVCRTIRRFFEWVRSIARQYERSAARPEFGQFRVGRALRGLVDVCDRDRGLVVLVGPGAARAFEVPPRRAKVWDVLRLLVQTDDPHGDVELPANYASHFHSTTSGNESKQDDLARLVRHIHPSAHRVGFYHLAYEPKDSLRRDA